MKAEVGPVKLETAEADYEAIQKVSKVGIFQILSDQFGYWRQCNLIRISKKFKEKCEKEGIDPREVSPKFLAQFIEAASLDEDADIQDMWADLLTKEAQTPGSVSLRTISALKAISKEEANLFQHLYGNSIRLGGKVAIYNDRNEDNNTIDDIIKLVDCGLIVSDNTLITFTTTVPPRTSAIIARSPTDKYIIVAQNKTDEEKKCVIPIFSLTEAGQDILSATIDKNTDGKFLPIAKKIKNENSDLSVTLSKLNYIDPKSGTVNFDNKDLLS